MLSQRFASLSILLAILFAAQLRECRAEDKPSEEPIDSAWVRVALLEYLKNGDFSKWPTGASGLIDKFRSKEEIEAINKNPVVPGIAYYKIGDWIYSPAKKICFRTDSTKKGSFSTELSVKRDKTKVTVTIEGIYIDEIKR